MYENPAKSPENPLTTVNCDLVVSKRTRNDSASYRVQPGPRESFVRFEKSIYPFQYDPGCGAGTDTYLYAFSETLILPGTPVVSVRLVRFTVLPNKQYRGIRCPITPVTTSPLWMPMVMRCGQTIGTVANRRPAVLPAYLRPARRPPRPCD